MLSRRFRSFLIISTIFCLSLYYISTQPWDLDCLSSVRRHISMLLPKNDLTVSMNQENELSSKDLESPNAVISESSNIAATSTSGTQLTTASRQHEAVTTFTFTTLGAITTTKVTTPTTSEGSATTSSSLITATSTTLIAGTTTSLSTRPTVTSTTSAGETTTSLFSTTAKLSSKKPVQLKPGDKGFKFKFILCEPTSGRLGNDLFIYASSYGIAKRNNVTLITLGQFHMKEFFHLSDDVEVIDVKDPIRSEVTIIREQRHCSFDENLYTLNVTGVKRRNLGTNDGAEVTRFMQSWYYFRDVAEDLRRQFTFKANIKSEVDKFFARLRSGTSRDKTTYDITINSTTYVGVHVRRGDMLLLERKHHWGFTTGSTDFIVRAMLHYVNLFRHVTFIVCSDDLKWCENNVKLPAEYADKYVVHLSTSNAVFKERRTDRGHARRMQAALDMGILSACNHSIISGGTFGWWSAYLAGGNVVYYAGYPSNGSDFATQYSETKADFYLPNWIGMM